MKRIVHAVMLGAVAFAAGLLLQCGTSPGVFSADGGIDGLLADLGLKAEAAVDAGPVDAEAPADWFTLEVRRQGGGPDVLLTAASDVSVAMKQVLVNGKIVLALQHVVFSWFNASTKRAARLSLSTVNEKVISRPTTVAFGNQSDAHVGSVGQFNLSDGFGMMNGYPSPGSTMCYSNNGGGSGTLKLTTVSETTITGSFDIQCGVGSFKEHHIKGTFEVHPQDVVPAGELRTK